MLHKFERYISKNTPATALAVIKQKAAIAPYNYQGKPADNYALYNWGGWQMRQRVEPNKYNLIENKKRIGKIIKRGLGPTTKSSVPLTTTQHAYDRKVYVFKGETNHMQSTPRIYRKGWYMSFETLGYYRSHSMLYGRNSVDPWRTWGNRFDIQFPDMNNCVGFARSLGLEVDIVYPHERYHAQKAYADNFNFIKETISDVEDEEEIVHSVMSKLV